MTAVGRVCVTGATGFVGRSTVSHLRNKGCDVVAAGRAQVGEIDGRTDWVSIFGDGVDSIVHLANMAHAGPIGGRDDRLAAQCRAVNVDGTVRLATQARDWGVRRFVFVSSLKAVAETGSALSPQTPPNPVDVYGRCKLQAEQALQSLAGGGMEVTILRPPLVYGEGVKANFLSLLRLVDRLPVLPLGAAENRRSLIYVGNLADAIHFALSCPPGLYHPRDGQDLSVRDLVAAIAVALGARPYVPAVPLVVLRVAAALAGKSEALSKLTEPLTSDGAMPGWVPPFTLDQGLARTAAWYRGQVRR